MRRFAIATLASLQVLVPALLPLPAASQVAGLDADVALDPGHSYADVGASGAGLREYEVTLDIAVRAARLLEARGYSVRLTRNDFGPLSAMNHPDSTERIRIEQEARIAAAGRVRCYVSLHFNGSISRVLAGTETYYNPENFGEESYRLAEALQRQVVDMLWQVGHPARDRGVKSDLLAGKSYGHFFNLRGPWPSALVEGMFLSNELEAGLLWRDEVRQALAEGYSRGVSEYLGPAPSGG